MLADGAGFVVLAEESRALLPAEVQELMVLGMPQEFTQYVVSARCDLVIVNFVKATELGIC